MLYGFYKRFIRPPSANDYVVTFPWELTPHTVFGTGTPPSSNTDPVSNYGTFLTPNTVPQMPLQASGQGHGDYELTSLLGFDPVEPVATGIN